MGVAPRVGFPPSSTAAMSCRDSLSVRPVRGGPTITDGQIATSSTAAAAAAAADDDFPLPLPLPLPSAAAPAATTALCPSTISQARRSARVLE